MRASVPKPVFHRVTAHQAGEEARRRRQWSSTVAQAAGHEEARDRQEAARARRDACNGCPDRLSAHARVLGQRSEGAWGRPLSRGDHDLRWLDSISGSFIAALDALVSRHPPPGCKAEYVQMLGVGIDYAGDHARGPEGARGLKFLALAKAVTTGRLRTDAAPRALVEVRGRIRLVLRGQLQDLVLEMERDAAADEADGVCAEPCGLRRDDDNAKRLRVVLRLCAAGYLSKGFCQVWRCAPGRHHQALGA